jgi:hypothetical protein
LRLLLYGLRFVLIDEDFSLGHHYDITLSYNSIFTFRVDDHMRNSPVEIERPQVLGVYKSINDADY